MAKRKRLTPALPGAAAAGAAPETKSAPFGWVGTRRPPIADVAAEAASQAALDEVSTELRRAREEGRMVLSLPLESIRVSHMVRDRVVLDPEDMTVLKTSLRDRGQQTPIDVVELGEGAYGLISGWRRVSALQALLEETGDGDRFGHVKALVRVPEGATEAYRAMVEENEVRASLSFYERAHIALKAVEQGVYPDVQAAVQGLYAAARAPKRSKIIAFAVLVEAFEGVFRFPAAVPEKVGLALVSAVQSDARFRDRLIAAVRAGDPTTEAEERAIINRELLENSRTQSQIGGATKKAAEDVAPGVAFSARKGRIILSGKSVDNALIAELRDWLARRRVK